MYNRCCPLWEAELLVRYRWERLIMHLRQPPIPALAPGGPPQIAAAWRRSGDAPLFRFQASVREVSSIQIPIRFRKEKEMASFRRSARIMALLALVTGTAGAASTVSAPIVSCGSYNQQTARLRQESQTELAPTLTFSCTVYNHWPTPARPGRRVPCMTGKSCSRPILRSPFLRRSWAARANRN